MGAKIISFQPQQDTWRKDYRYGLYKHKLVTEDNEIYTRSFIVIKNRFDVIVRFTRLHNFAGVYEGKIFAPVCADAEAKMYYICAMLNYVFIDHYDEFKITHVFTINREMLEQFFRDYAEETLADGSRRGQQSIEKCVKSVTLFFQKLRRKYGARVLLSEPDIIIEKPVYSHGKVRIKKVPSFQVRGFIKTKPVLRELPTKAFRVLLDLAFRYTPDIAFAICLQAFAGLRAGEVCNVRQESSPLGNGIVFTYFEGVANKVEINLTRELQLRSDGVITGKIKKERIQCVYPPFLKAFCTAYERHKLFLAAKQFEGGYRPMFINKKGMAMTYDDYALRFSMLVDERLKPAMLNSGDAECRVYGQMLCEKRLVLHLLRHWFTVQLVLNGEDIAQVQYWRGDKSPESAFTYLQNKGELVKELKHAGSELTEILVALGKQGVDRLV